MMPVFMRETAIISTPGSTIEKVVLGGALAVPCTRNPL